MMAAVALLAAPLRADETNLARNADCAQTDAGGKPVAYELTGGALYRKTLGDPRADAATGGGVALAAAAGAVSQTILIDPKQGRSFSFRFRGLPQDEFSTTDDGLLMQVEFFGGDGGRTAYDGKVKQIYPLVQQARRDLTANGNGHTGGAAVWRDYVLNFYVPFPQVDRVRLTVACKGSVGGAEPPAPPAATPVPSPTPAAPRPDANRRDGRPRREGGAPPPKRIDTAGRAFFVGDFRLTRLPEPVDPHTATTTATAFIQPPAGELLPLGGRWFYRVRKGETKPPAVFDHANADRLLYRDGPGGSCETPFAGNMSTVLHPGNADLAGNTVAADRPVVDNVTVRFESGSLVIHTHGLPNHPTGKFPEDGFGPGVNPSSIQEQDETYYLPLEPKSNPAHVVTNADNSNRALNMGPIGVAVNGVVFFNPFDAASTDASNLMDRCCGHPNQDGQYHYHKYPVCLNSPWSDEGKEHSPLLGWAFDGLPVYGPYESAGVMAKDVTGPGVLNAFNAHYDEQRGWHYHVTPGRFPYLIGGYWAQADRRNVHPPRHPRGGRGGEGPPPPGEDGFPPDGFPPDGPPPGPPPW